MKKTLITLLVLAGVASADLYTWNDEITEGSWATSTNWKNNNGYYPQSDGDSATVNAGNVTINWTHSECQSGENNYFGQTNTITLNNGNVLNMLIDGTASANISVKTFNLNNGATVYLGCNNALGYGNDFAVNYGTFTADSHGLFDASTSMTGSLWGNGYTITLTGTFDASNLADLGSETGSIVLYNAKAASDTLNVADNITIEAPSYFTVEKVWEGNTLKINYTIPEPATATLSLLALAGLAARRRRK